MGGAPRVAVLGFGNQGAAQAHCLRASGWSVVVGARAGQGAERARAAGFEVRSPADAAAGAQFVAALVPDEVFPGLYRESLKPSLGAGTALVFAHGFSIVYGELEWPAGVDVVLVSPTAPGRVLAAEFDAGRGVPAYLAVAQDGSGHAWERAEIYAAGIGSNRAGLLRTSVDEEVAVDLFGEQSVLVGGLMALVSAAVDALLEAGYSPAMAYLECAHQVKYLADLFHREGPVGFARAVSATALYGGLTRGPRIIGDEARRALGRILVEIRSGAFATEFLADQENGGPILRRLVEEATSESWARLESARAQALGPVLSPPLSPASTPALAPEPAPPSGPASVPPPGSGTGASSSPQRKPSRTRGRGAKALRK